MPNHIEILSSLEDFFREEVKSVSKNQRAALNVEVSGYVAQLLVRFSQSSSMNEQLLASGEKSKQPILALLWLEGLQKRPAEQATQMQYLGDVALFTSGFFADRIDRSLLDRDYYVAMGEQAYRQAGSLQNTLRSDEALRDLFYALSRSFPRMVSVLEEISFRSQAAQNNGIVKLYEKWLASNDRKLERVLQENGVIPQNSKKGERN